MVWTQGGALADILAKTRKKPEATPVVPGSLFPLAPKELPGETNVTEQRGKNLQAAYQRMSAVDDVGMGLGQGGSDYLQRAEDIMFNANKVNQQASEARLKNTLAQYQNIISQLKTPQVNVKTTVRNVPGQKGGANMPALGKGKKAALIRAIAGKESGGNYGAVNRDSGALGKYQIMPSNIAGPGGWDKEALGRNITTQQFLSTPKLQEAIARYKLSKYFDQFGAAGAASAWYSGSPTKWKTSYGGQGAYPSIHNYVMSILKAMGMK